MDEGRPQTAPPSPPGSARAFESNPTLLGLSQIKGSPKWTFNGRHAAPRTHESPGPGAYSLYPADRTSRYKQAPQYAFSVSSRENGTKIKVPGPGAYGASQGIGQRGVSYSLTPRRSARPPLARELPGPGAHELKSFIGEGPKFSASTRGQEFRKGSRPGPGDYDHVDNHVAEKHPSWGFGTSTRPDARSSQHQGTPGPGAYMTNTKVGEGPKYSMKARLQGPRLQQMPGPGAHGGHYTTFG
mmetsp:Transcript_80872/g.228934  ORF Transcript_80872/g.228934 Transcript_80872/m.228934 type:complete len:242 (+) Transcript_80872:1-726(+)